MTEYVCPQDKVPLIEKAGELACKKCGTKYIIEDGVPVFTAKENRGYWSNVSRSDMRNIIIESEETGDWQGVVKEKLPKYERHILPIFRGDIQYIFPTNSKSVILDAGSMWGGVTIPVARHCKKIYAIDKTWESLRFLSLRAKQDGFKNIHVAEGSISSLPFADEYFDHIILNGVLEWIAMEEEVVLEQNWAKEMQKSISYAGKSDPEQAQLKGLKELCRVTKGDGSIYVAIENRIGLQYFFGYPDDHVNIRFVSFLPRCLANFITRRIKNHDYRTYLYSPSKLRNLLLQAGYKEVELYSSFPHYNIISRLVPFSVFDDSGAISYNGDAPLDVSGRIKVFLFSVGWRLIPNPFRKYLCPSISLIATKCKRPVARIVAALAEAKIIQHDSYFTILANNRFSDDVPTIILLKNKKSNTTEFFCKVARGSNNKALKHESAMLQVAYDRLSKTTMSNTVPRLVYYGVLDGVELQVSRYVGIKPTDFPLLSGVIKVLYQSDNRLMQKLIPTLMSRWVRRYDESMNKAIEWLAKFQQATRCKTLPPPDSLVDLLEECVCRLQQDRQRTLARSILKKISVAKVGPIHMTMEHGDFDVCNIFKQGDGQIFVVDFEHAEECALPFFDLGNLLFSTLVNVWRRNGKGQTLKSYSDKIGMTPYLLKWLRCYSELSGVPLGVLRYLPALAVIAQHVKTFPESRDITDYPMYGDDAFDQMIRWELPLKN